MKKRRDLLIAVAVLGGCLVAYKTGQFGGVGPCSQDMQAIATACEMYASDHAGRYPTELKELTPRYLSSTRCPLGGGAYAFESAKSPDTFTLVCRGSHYQRSGFRPGHPYYTASYGWCMKPGNYPSMPPDKYLELHDHPDL